jgi:AcrR family transcriptional regulator
MDFVTRVEPRANGRAEEVLQAAAALFDSKGYSATTVTDIANAAGLSPATLYHHFPSKQEIAIAMLDQFGHDLDRVACGFAREQRGSGIPAEERVQLFAREITTFSMRNSAAVALRSFEAPRLATERFHAAVRVQVPTRERVWKAVVKDLVAELPDPLRVDPCLLRFALDDLTITASAFFPLTSDPAQIAQLICDLLLGGLATDCPDDAALDLSAATRVARESMAQWPLPPVAPRDERTRILAAARREFSRRSFDATTVNDIVDASGVPKGTLYRVFESKEALVRAAMADYEHCADSSVRAVLDTQGSAVDKLDALGRVVVRLRRRFREDSEIIKLGWSGRRSAASPFHDFYIKTRQRAALQAEVLAQGITSGELRDLGSPEDLVHAVRHIQWLRFHDYARTSERRAVAFLRGSLLRGANAST